jgi:plastocyanin domain-containing protein
MEACGTRNMSTALKKHGAKDLSPISSPNKKIFLNQISSDAKPVVTKMSLELNGLECPKGAFVLVVVELL